MDAAHFEKKLTSEVLFEGRVITLTKDTALLENGKTATREVVHHHGGACIVPYFEDGTICMVRQFRYAMQQELWELPAGKLEAGEDPFEAARRELEEECGLTAEHYTSLGEFYPTVGYDTEVIYTWVATGLGRLGSVISLTAKAFPLGQVLPVMMSSPSFSSMVRRQPRGQPIHTSCFILPPRSQSARRCFRLYRILSYQA